MIRPYQATKITDSVCELDLPPTRFQELSLDYRLWFKTNRTSSSAESRPYLRTRLGYTCDWYQGQGCGLGLIKIVIWPGSTKGLRLVRATQG